jgi:hypothetical protein
LQIGERGTMKTYWPMKEELEGGVQCSGSCTVSSHGVATYLGKRSVRRSSSSPNLSLTVDLHDSARVAGFAFDPLASSSHLLLALLLPERRWGEASRRPLFDF